ncbi:unnamed protein product [Psylliodes chrysocephalus]|nr:unnamed protein product [Psylliodes chrysocephala]
MKTVIFTIIVIFINISFAENMTNLARKLERRRSYYFKKNKDNDDYTVINRVAFPDSNLTELKYPVIKKESAYQTYEKLTELEPDYISTKLDPKLLQAFMEKVTKFAQTCIEETKASGDDVAQLMAHTIPDTHEGKCMISCVYKKFKIQNEDGTINTEEANKLMEKVKDNDAELYEKLNTVYQTCNKPSIVVEDHCLTAVNLASCAVAEAKKV